jgi:hypothetical protein
LGVKDIFSGFFAFKLDHFTVNILFSTIKKTLEGLASGLLSIAQSFIGNFYAG